MSAARRHPIRSTHRVSLDQTQGLPSIVAPRTRTAQHSRFVRAPLAGISTVRRASRVGVEARIIFMAVSSPGTRRRCNDTGPYRSLPRACPEAPPLNRAPPAPSRRNEGVEWRARSPEMTSLVTGLYSSCTIRRVEGVRHPGFHCRDAQVSPRRPAHSLPESHRWVGRTRSGAAVHVPSSPPHGRRPRAPHGCAQR